jgi:hypothetical protein
MFVSSSVVVVSSRLSIDVNLLGQCSGRH